MATLQSIRKRGVLLVTVIAVALFLFVAGDLFRGLESIFRNDALKVGEVNGKTLTIQDYQKQLDEFQNFYEIAQQKSSLSEEELNNVKDEAWQSFVQTEIISEECSKLGIAVTDDEVAAVVASGQNQLLQIPVFMNQQTGIYDYNSLVTFLSEYKKIKDAGSQVPEEYEKIYKYYLFAQNQIRMQLLSNKYQALLSNIFVSNPVEAKLTFDSRANEADILMASFPVESVKDDAVKVSDDEIKARYNENKAKYEQFVETRDLKIIDVQVLPSDADRKATEANVAEFAAKLDEADGITAAGNVVRQATSVTPYYDVYKTKDAYPTMIANLLDSVAVGSTTKVAFSPETEAYYAFKMLAKTTQVDSVLYRQIGVIGKDEADIEKKADSIMTALSAGAKFVDIAKKYNQTGDSSWISTSQFERASLDADNVSYINEIFSMSAGENKKLKLESGSVIILQAMKTAHPVSKYKVAAVIKELKFSDDTYNQAYNKFSSFVAENKTIEQIEANAPQAGYTVRPISDVMSSAHNIADIRGTRDALKWAFDEAKVGNISPLYECGSNDHLLLVALDNINKPGIRSVEKMKETITEELMNEKKLDELCKAAESVKSIAAAQKLSAIVDTVSRVSFNSPAYVPATKSSEPLVGAVAMKTDVKAVSAPVKGKAGVYIIQVLNKRLTQETFDAKQEEATISMTAFRSAINMAFSTLYRKAQVKDNRYKFF